MTLTQFLDSYNIDEYNIILNWWQELETLTPDNIHVKYIVSSQRNIPNETRDELFNWIDTHHPQDICDCDCCKNFKEFMKLGLSEYLSHYSALQCFINHTPANIHSLPIIKNTLYKLNMSDTEFNNYKISLDLI